MRSYFVFAFAAVALAGCVPANTRRAPLSESVTILVRNPSSQPVSVTVCAPGGCQSERSLAPGSRSRFVVSSRGGTRVVVTAKQGERVVAQHPVDFSPGEEIVVDISLPQARHPARTGGSR
jgi:hypothetical protein